MFDLSSNDSDRTTGRTEFNRRSRLSPHKHMPRDGQAASNAVAIIGMSCLFPGAEGLDAFWRNILGKVDAVTDPPPEARETGQYFDPDSHEGDRVYCKRGGYLGSLAAFDPLSHGIPPVAVGGEPDQWLSLQLARDALADAGCLRMDEAVRRKTAVILGKGTYLNGGNAIAVQHGLVVNQTLEILKTLRPEYTDDQIEALRRELKQALPPFNPETMPGLVPNIIVGRIANRLDLMGPTYTVDAACASSLIAVQQAMRCLVSGECDVALAGGSQVWIPMPTLSIFCQLGALSRTQRIRPFDEEADGTLLGEGIGMIVLKRLRDAERDQDRIYAVIRGVGVASDGRGLSVMAPRVEGEELALRRAYEAAGVSPRTVGLIEAHGTGTPVGDVVELQALTRVFGTREGDLPRCALGTVKSMISHTIPAAGVAGIIKTALSLYHKILPPTLHCERPNPKLELEQTPFYLNSETRPWIQGSLEPRRAGVNAFGFGGINAHAVLEEHSDPLRAASSDPAAKDLSNHLPAWDSEVCLLGAESPAELLEEVQRLARRLDSAGDVAAGTIRLADLAFTLNQDLMTSGAAAPCRLALVASSMPDLREKLDRAAKKLATAGGCRQIRDVSGVYFAAEPLAREGKLAFLFPGEGSQYPNMLADLCLHFPEVRECFDQIDRVYFDHPRGYVPSDHIFPRPASSRSGEIRVEERLWEIAGAVEAVLTANQAELTLMSGLGLRPDVIVGHSTGEFSALRAAGIFDPDKEEFFELSLKLYQNYEEASRVGLPRAVLLAVGADRERVEAIAREAEGEIYVAMDNCPHQAVLVGGNEVSDRALAIVRKQGFLSEQLNFDRAYHTPLFAPYVDHLRQIFEEAQIRPARVPIYSCTTAAPYPDDPAAIRKLMVDHWLLPVEFRRTIETLYDDGVRIFVEVGPRGNLSSFVDDILRGRRFCAVPANVQRRSGIMQLNHLVAILTAHGVDMDLRYLYRRRHVKRVDLDSSSAAASQPPSRAPMKLTTGFPAMRVSAEFASRLRADAPVPRNQPLSTPRRLQDAGAAIDEPSASIGECPAPERAASSVPIHTNGHAPVSPSKPVVPSQASNGSMGSPMIQDFLRTMNEYLVVQDRVMQDGLGSGDRTAVEPEPSTRTTTPDRSPKKSPFPLLGEVVSGKTREELIARRVFDPAIDFYLRDHTLGRDVSRTDPDLLALPVMPLTMSMEVMAEAASFLAPGRKVVGFRNLRAFRWIAFDEGPQELQVTARRQPGDFDRVAVQIRNLTEDRRGDSPPASPAIEASVMLADSYPPRPPGESTAPRDGRPSRLRPERLYSDVMFHGPSWQGVASIERVADDGSLARLRVLPFDGLLDGRPNPDFVLDPMLLDAAGQVIGFWTAEHLTTGKVIFPSGLESLEIYGPNLAPGAMPMCEATIRLEGDRRLRSDIEIVARDGLLLRLAGWEDWRFDLPATFHPLILPTRGDISEPWPDPVESFPSPRFFACRRLCTSLPADLGLWRRVWAHQVLSRAEREEFRRMAAPEIRQLEWLVGRTAAKEAARDLLRSHLGLEPPLADIEIRQDERGRLMVDGAWAGELNGDLVVSISLDAHLAVALAGLLPAPVELECDGGSYVGIHTESSRARREEAGEPVLSEAELRLLRDRPLDRLEEWWFRCQCAKKAVANALGERTTDALWSISIAGVAPEMEAVFVRLTDRLAKAHPRLAAAPLVVFTSVHDRSVVATTLCQGAGSADVLAVAGTDREIG
ncbi:Phthiocerol/phenolphthiocerol synthesis polyketide synthase type I PpsE [Paludisphaera borealis]|uniref:Phthiocerol/phenolphthiocerol synthesis polyketide synthase type I PpsE n=2 Tax=Paludisphaera borealis TaxID=1387353 RepID=A0A1U7CTT7_9BACT|nr:Phthiocerol/phenolphthiocerol synthesis polyketide synthase type I PpsE [Paludisphaera borealis]